MLKLEDLRAWFISKGVTAAIAIAEQPETPDECLTLTDTPGLGLTLEGAFDRPSFQAIARGAPNLRAQVRDFAYQIDSLILDSSKPFQLGAYQVVDAGRVGGNPGYLGLDDKRRIEYTANYWMEISR